MIITASPVFIGKMIWSFVYGTADVILPIEWTSSTVAHSCIIFMRIIW
jgi:hypothetical protein